MKHSISIISLLILFSFSARSQVAINNDGSQADASAILDISSTEKGTLITRMTTAQRTAMVSPAEGLLVFDTETDSFWYYNTNTSQWTELTTEANDTDNWTVSGENMYNANTGNIGIGTENPGAKLEVAGQIKITGGTPGNDKVLTSDADGLASWQTPDTYATEIDELSDGKNDGKSLFLGTNAGQSDDGNNRNTVVGNYSANNNTEGFCNSFFGYESGEENTTGAYNVAIGSEALKYNSSGYSNTAVGSYAGSGSNGNSYSGCVFLGYEAGENNTSDNKLYIDNSSTSNPLIGGDFSNNQVDINGTIKITGGTPGSGKVLTSDADGLASWETPEINDMSDAVYNGSDLFLGNGAGNSNSGSNNNVAVGRNTLNSNTTNDFNTAVGNLSLEVSTGQRNTAIGYYSMHSNTTGSFNTSLGYRTGYNSTTGENNTFVGYNARVVNSTFRENSTALGNEAIITASHQVRIGNDDVATIGGIVSWTTLSDGRFKENIKEDVAGLDFVLSLRPVSYTVNKQAFKSFVGSEYESNSRHTSQREVGFVAQEVEELVKSMDVEFNGVDAPKNDADYYGIRYSQFVIPLVKSVQELNEKLEQQNAKLKTQNEELLNRIEKLEQILLKK